MLIKHISFLFFILPLLLGTQNLNTAKLWKEDKTLSGASYGYSVIDVKSGNTLAELNSGQLLIPASTLKLVTTFAALTILGSDFRYETKLQYSGNLNKESGVLEGDLIITGSGDPSLQSEYFGKESITDSWAKILKQMGIKRITGKIIGNASCFERAIPGEWIWCDIGNYFGASPCGLSYMDNKFKLIYHSGQTGSYAKLTETSPNYLSLPYNIESKVLAKGNEDEAYVFGDPFSFKKEVSGSIPPNKNNYEVEAALPDPALLCAEMLYSSLVKAGIICQKNSAVSSYVKNEPGFVKGTLHVHKSPTLGKLIFHTNLKSNNMYCESLLLTMGKGVRKDGIEVVKMFCSQRGLNTNELFMSDGCGLSRANTISAGFLANTLLKCTKDTLTYKIIRESLPVAGSSGSMSNIGRGTFIEGNMRAKTGYINRARAYSGYLKTKTGRELAFSVMMNNYTCSAKEAKLKLEKFLIELGEL